ncbi:hypothetical protein OPT61_g6583 [Boeremia exigua]|uniref:Uncharacterized protein n=1 Tax=Boeremia exigua TaxID=749465 RepID=A0ACC2I5Y5_9PLEO|nr:hypothetical protein OPT61_g6583 [Boeremia exigua]
MNIQNTARPSRSTLSAIQASASPGGRTLPRIRLLGQTTDPQLGNATSNWTVRTLNTVWLPTATGKRYSWLRETQFDSQIVLQCLNQ